jgi:vanillate O-demethylase ferredoxin subunit
MTDKAFSVVLARAGRTVAVGEGESILDVVLLEGLDVPNACQQGVCGTCETRVLAGTPDHRDFLLSEAEHAANNTMMICCSRSLTDTLTLDL